MEDLNPKEELELLEMELRALLKKMFARDLEANVRIERIKRQVHWEIVLHATTH